jgi:hypothetical protein
VKTEKGFVDKVWLFEKLEWVIEKFRNLKNKEDILSQIQTLIILPYQCEFCLFGSK